MAMGILMSSRLLTAEQAFEQLRTASQRLHRKLRDVAAEVTETGALPDLPSQ
jgi:AmiR/NasT family two-component response regulator